MKDFFNEDNAFMRFLGTIADCILLNIVFILCCLPVVTIGASVTALYYVAFKLSSHDDGYIIRRFFKSFKENFKQASMIWLVMLVAGVVLGMDFYILRFVNGTALAVLRVMVVMLAAFYVAEFIYVFATLCRFGNTIKNTFRNAMCIAIGNLPGTIVMVLVTAGAVAITFYNVYTMWYGIMVWFMAGFALLALVHSYFLKKVYLKFIH